MIVVSNRISVNPEHAAAFEEAFANRAGLTDTMPGFISYQLLKPTEEGAPYIVMTMWQTMENFRAWTESDAFKQGHARSGTLPRETFLGRPVLEIHEIIQTTSEG